MNSNRTKNTVKTEEEAVKVEETGSKKEVVKVEETGSVKIGGGSSEEVVNTEETEGEGGEGGEGGEEGDDDDDDVSDYKYTRKDVTYICEKLYRDELLSVFGAESVDDPEMDKGIRAIFEALIANDEFKQLLVELNALLLDLSSAKNETEIANLKRNTDYLIFLTLFSQQAFYLTHKCLCQMITLGKVLPDMMNQLKQRALKIFSLN